MISTFGRRIGHIPVLAILLAALALAWAGSAIPVQAQSGMKSYVTLEVAADDSFDTEHGFGLRFTVTWVDANDCTSEFNAYLYSAYGIVDAGDPQATPEPRGHQTHLGSADSDGDQITQSLTVNQRGIPIALELYCGTYDPESDQNLVSSVVTSNSLIGTYTSAPPITLLTVSTGTLTPAFHRGRTVYTVPDVPIATN